MVVNLCLLAKALLSYPLPFYAAAEILQTGVLKLNSSAEGSERGTLLLRGSLLLLTLIMALCVPHFSLLMGLTGSVTGAAMTLLLPALFHLQLKWTQLDEPQGSGPADITAGLFLQRLRGYMFHQRNDNSL